MARQYETIFFMDHSLESDLIDDLVGKIEEIIKNNEGKILNVDKWGTRTLSYEVDGTNQAIYYMIEFEGENSTLEKLKRFYLINNQDILNFSIIKKEKEKATVRRNRERRESLLRLQENREQEEQKYFAAE